MADGWTGLQGQSLATIDKERRIGSALAIGMKVASAHFGGKGRSYWHFDANCGSGWNQRVSVAGSPIVFWQVAQACLCGMRPEPFFCDIDQTAMHELHLRLARAAVLDPSILIPGDNEEALAVFAERVRRVDRSQYAVGSVLIDPNGYFYRRPDGQGAPVNAIKWFVREFLRIDLILNLNVRTYQMQKGASEKLGQNHDVQSPRELLPSLGKKFWLVGRGMVGGGDRFLLAVGRNFSTGDHRALGLHKLESLEGQAIMNWAEGQRQHELPELSAPSSLPRRSRRRDAQHGQQMLELRSTSDRSASHSLSAVGDVRRPVEPEAALPPLPLRGARQG